MNIWYLYKIIRLPIWFIVMTMIAFAFLLLILLVVWFKKNQYHKLYRDAGNDLNKSQSEMRNFTSKCKITEEEIQKLNNVIETYRSQLQEKNYCINNLNSKLSLQEASIEENRNQFLLYESEKLNLSSKLQTKEESIKNIESSLKIAKNKIQEIEQEKDLLKNQLKSTLEILTQRVDYYNELEKRYNQVELENKALENSKNQLINNVDSLKISIKEQEDAHKAEIKNLNSKNEKEKYLLKEQLKNTQEILTQTIDYFNNLEKRYNQVEHENKALESSKKLLGKEIEKLKIDIKEQTDIYKSEIRSLNLKINRRNEKIEKINKIFTETKEKLQTIQDEKTLTEKKLQEVENNHKEQNKHAEKSKNIIERLAQW